MRDRGEVSRLRRAHWQDRRQGCGRPIALDILGGAPVTVTEKRFAEPKVIAIMLMSRTLSNFRGVFTLIENGLVVEARILVRCCFDGAGTLFACDVS